MKVCFLISKYPISEGGQVNLDYLINFYKKYNIDVKIYTGCKLSIGSVRKFLKFIKKEKIDVVQTIDIKPEFVFNTLFARLYDRKIIFSCVGKLSEDQNFFIRLTANIFSNSIIKLLTDKKFYEKKRKISIENSKKYTKEKMFKNYKEIYEMV